MYFLGVVERRIYTKSHNRQAYRDARKVAWGDLFPHEPKVILHKYGANRPESSATSQKRSRRSTRYLEDQ